MFALLHGQHLVALERETLQTLRGTALAHKTVYTEQVSAFWEGMLKVLNQQDMPSTCHAKSCQTCQ